MRFTGSSDFAADRTRVWTFLVDPASLGPCSPVPIERVDEGRYVASARVGGGFFASTLRVDLQVTDAVPGQGARIVAHGGMTGATMVGSSTFAIRTGSADGITTVDWEVELEVSGMFAGPAERLIADRAQTTMDQLLRCILAQVEG